MKKVKRMRVLVRVFIFVLGFVGGVWGSTQVKAAEKSYGSTSTSTDGNWEYQIIEMDSVATDDIAVKYIGEERNVTIPDAIDGYTVTELAYEAFYDVRDTIFSVDATTATHLSIIGEDAFYDCKKLVSFTYLPANITKIGNEAFYSCEKLASIELPTNSAYRQIEEYTFSGCISLSSVTIGGNIFELGKGAFYRSGLVRIVIPETVDTMGSEGFYGCSKLVSATLSVNELLTEIPESTFSGCTSLKSISIPSNYTSIGESAFSDSQLCYIIIPQTITEINASAFSRSSIQYIQFLATTSPTMSGGDQFYGCSKLQSVITPVGAEATYKAAFDAAGDTSLPENIAYGGSSVAITVLPQPSIEFGKKMTVTGTLYEGATVSTIALTGTFVDAVTGIEVPGVLAWREPNMKYEEGTADVAWSFTPASTAALPINGIIEVPVEAQPQEPPTGTGTGTGTGAGILPGTTTTTTTNVDQVILTDQNKNIITTTTTQLVRPKKPTIRSIKSKGKKTTVRWKKAIKGANGYQIFVSTKKKTGYKMKKAVKGYKTMYGVLKGLKKGKTYYIKVRTYKQVNGIRAYSKYSAVKKFVMK